MTFTMYDDVNVSLIPTDATHCSYYATSHWANLNAMRAHVPHAKLMPVLDSRGVVPPFHDLYGYEHGVEIDIEPTLWIPSDAGPFARRALSAGVKPVFYCSLSMAADVVASLHAAGVTRSQFKLHTAHWTGAPHICSGIATAMGTIDADATQYTDRALGRSLDESLCRDDFFGAASPPPPAPPPPPEGKYPTGQARAEVIVDYDKPVGHRLSVRGVSGSWSQGTDQQLELMQVAFEKSGVWRVAGIPNNTKPLG